MNEVISLMNRDEYQPEVGMQVEDQILQWLADTGEDGATAREFGEALSLHHGQASSTLSRLHRRGKIARLTEKRDRYKVYVHPDFVDGRKVDPERPFRLVDELADVLNRIPEAALGMADSDWQVERTSVLFKYSERRG